MRTCRSFLVTLSLIFYAMQDRVNALAHVLIFSRKHSHHCISLLSLDLLAQSTSYVPRKICRLWHLYHNEKSFSKIVKGRKTKVGIVCQYALLALLCWASVSFVLVSCIEQATCAAGERATITVRNAEGIVARVGPCRNTGLSSTNAMNSMRNRM